MMNYLKEMGFWKSLMYFAIPGIWIYVALYVIVPHFLGKGLNLCVGVMGSMWIVTIPMIGLGIVLYWRENKERSFKGFLMRFRFHRLNKKAVEYIVLGVVISFVSEGVLGGTGHYFAQFHMLAPPDYLPIPFNPLKQIAFPMTEYMGISLKGNWLFLILFIILHSLAMLGEEIMWRGYILPRQEIRFGRMAWLVNGLLWAYVMHLCLKWNVIAMLPSMLIAPYAAQKTQNTWVSLGIHMIPNMMIWAMILIGVAGV